VPYISATLEHDIYPEVWETFIRDSVCVPVLVIEMDIEICEWEYLLNAYLCQ